MKKFALSVIACVVLMGFVFSQDVTVTQPDANSEWIKGKTYTIQWISAGKAPAYVKLTIYSLKNRQTRVIMKKSINNGKLVWTVPQDIPPGNYEIRLSMEDGRLLARSKMFKILEPVKMMRSVTRVQASAVRSLPSVDSKTRQQQVRIKQNLIPLTKNRLDNIVKSLHADIQRMKFSEFHQVALNKARKEFPNASQKELDVVMFYVLGEIEKKLRQEIEKNQSTRSDMSQMMQLELQDKMNKHTQIMQIIGNILKVMHDTSMAIIRNLR